MLVYSDSSAELRVYSLRLEHRKQGRNMDIEKTYDIPFPIEIVYAAWVSSDTVIAPATAMDIDPVVGGHYRLIMESPDYTGRNEGVFLAVTPNEHVRYTWEWNRDDEISEIDVTFASTENGTGIKILHTGFQKQESADMHSSGWDSYMKGFAAFLAPTS